MLTLHLDIISEEAARVPLPRTAAFRGERPAGLEGTPEPLVGDELLEAVREVVWFKDEVLLEGDR